MTLHQKNTTPTSQSLYCQWHPPLEAFDCQGEQKNPNSPPRPLPPQIFILNLCLYALAGRKAAKAANAKILQVIMVAELSQSATPGEVWKRRRLLNMNLPAPCPIALHSCYMFAQRMLALTAAFVAWAVGTGMLYFMKCKSKFKPCLAF